MAESDRSRSRQRASIDGLLGERRQRWTNPGELARTIPVTHEFSAAMRAPRARSRRCASSHGCPSRRRRKPPATLVVINQTLPVCDSNVRRRRDLSHSGASGEPARRGFVCCARSAWASPGEKGRWLGIWVASLGAKQEAARRRRTRPAGHWAGFNPDAAVEFHRRQKARRCSTRCPWRYGRRPSPGG